MKKTLITTAQCGPCFMLKSKIKQQELEVDIQDAFETPEAMALCKKYGIKTVPTLLVERDDGTFSLVKGSEDIIAEIKKEDVQDSET